MRKRSTILIGAFSLLVLYFLLTLFVPVIGGPIFWIIGDKLDWESKRLAGWNAKNCGRVANNGNAGKASDCVLGAFQEHKAFRVRYETLSVDDTSAFAIVGAPDGHLYHLGFLGGSPDGAVSLLHQSVRIWHCPEPIGFHIEKDLGLGRGMISCR
jgi:hypothetical protein